ncbi:hypothetical protein KC343_g12330 [Hortaea werneckii]|uniref:Uncharacterized protein n=1 Tax=Hortaea werneckii TaxID=91943 RepID=A0A3M7BIV6_HORWE|nr:hypothetical protein KC352_g24885 [Hortaea werneckii]KAI7604668.1 hypothetical protein KC346_g11367 [Hortaea werneckii]KAI7609386.1 hypothetical protein KC343_g12330 [Hortaea werneckii]KAI7648114.1 hypothetical protein KC319_g11489 [Hortaea werneckii]KAI7689610.1 hypothetical protein KC322_g11743 [Hortaea werneckii]
MSATATLERNNETGLSNSTVSSSTSSSAERYRLDEFDTKPILLYKYRGQLQTSSQKDLCAWLDKDEKLRCTKKPLPRGTSYLDIKRHDLYLPDEKEIYSHYPNYDSSLAAIKVPSLPYWSRIFLGNYAELYIVSPESSPASSVADSESRKTGGGGISPGSTFMGESSREEEETRGGAGED